jgi:hypothetical protein
VVSGPLRDVYAAIRGGPEVGISVEGDNEIWRIFKRGFLPTLAARR